MNRGILVAAPPQETSSEQFELVLENTVSGGWMGLDTHVVDVNF